MPRKMIFWVFGAFLLLTMVFSPTKGSLATLEFELQVVGFVNDSSIIPGPCPPDSNESCTWDSYGYTGVVFRLLHNGSFPVTITSIKLWQEVWANGERWNFTEPLSIRPPLSPLGEGDSFEFLVNKTFCECGSSNQVYASIETSEEGIYLISSKIPTSLSLPKLTDTTPPKITIINPRNTTYSATVWYCGLDSFRLVMKIDEPTSWIGYSLDGEVNVTIAGNTTVDTVIGTHHFIVFANDTFGNMGKSEMIKFTIKSFPPTTTSSKTTSTNINTTKTTNTSCTTTSISNSSVNITSWPNISFTIIIVGVLVICRKQTRV